MRKRMKSTSMSVYSNRLRSNRQEPRVLNNRCSNECSSNRKKMMMTMMRRKYLVPTILTNMRIYQFRRNSRKCLSTYSVTSHRRLT